MEEFKVGSKVIVSSRNYNDKIRTVEKITPKGMIKVDGILYNASGSERSSDVWNVGRIRLATDEMIKKINEDNFIKNTIRAMRNIENLSFEKAEAIYKIIKNKED